MTLKSDFIEGAYSQLRISGLTVDPSPEDNVLALRRLENMMAEFFGRSINVGYYFENTPDSGTPHNVERRYWDAIESNLAFRLCPDFGIDVNQVLLAKQQSGYSFLSSATAIIREVSYPSRMPKGRIDSARTKYHQRYMGVTDSVPLEPESITMYVGDTEDFVESFAAYLVDGESISSYTIEASTGLTIDSSSLSSPEITYSITADGTGSDSANRLLIVKIVATSSNSRVVTRVINFELNDISVS